MISPEIGGYSKHAKSFGEELSPMSAKKSASMPPVAPPSTTGTEQKQGKNKAASSEPSVSAGPRTRIMQSDMPSISLDQALRVANGIWNDFAGKSAAPHDIAFAIGMTPTSGPWRTLTGAAIAYGITEGGYNADVIKLTPLGRRIVAPEEEGDDLRARAEAVLKPRVMREFFERYDRAKFPQDSIAANVLVTMGLPKDRAAEAVAALKETGKKTGLIRDTKTGLFVALPAAGAIPVVDAVTANDTEEESEGPNDLTGEAREARPAGSKLSPLTGSLNVTLDPATAGAPTGTDNNNKVFITHGKSRAVVNQIKELLQFGKFDPVMSVERESTAVPVPDKVFQDMRGCSAGVIHVNSEGELIDSDGKRHIHLNHNVLIEIGAAIALFKKRVILLVQKGVELPSNLQGLYRCEYEGDKLDYEATMKLLKTFNEFRSQG